MVRETGSPGIGYMAGGAAGIGHLGLIDADVVDITNLQRQVIHFTPDIGRPKVDSAKEKIAAINPDVTVTTYKDLFMASNALELIKDYDFIVDGTDNFGTKFLINDFLNSDSTDLVFKLAPRINAAGRMASAKNAVELLLSKDENSAKEWSETINAYNNQRRNLDAAITEEALKMAGEDDESKLEKMRAKQAAQMEEYRRQADEQRRQFELAQRTTIGNEARAGQQADFKLGSDPGMKRGGTYGFRRRRRQALMGGISASSMLNV